jgi:ABC-type lipoprotein export system ATPase subunit
MRDGRVVEEARAGAGRMLVATRGWIRLPGAAVTGAVDAAGVLASPPLPAAPAIAAPGAAGATAAELAGVEKHYGARAVLDGLTTAFHAGRLAAVVGRSGSGKTTLLHLLAGLERPSAGTVAVAGRPLAGLTRSELADLRRRSVALVTQEPGLVPYLSALENVELGLALRGSANGGARESLVAVGLEERLRHPVARLSAGERQRVAIARALAADVDLLLLDEPTARLDEASAAATGALLAALTSERPRTAIVCATHDPLLVERAADVLEL